MPKLSEDDQEEYSDKLWWCVVEIAAYLFITACILYALLYN